jgi:hypothetical protein
VIIYSHAAPVQNSPRQENFQAARVNMSSIRNCSKGQTAKNQS